MSGCFPLLPASGTTDARSATRPAGAARVSALGGIARIRLEHRKSRLLIRSHQLRHLIARKPNVLVQLRARIAECVASRDDRRDLFGRRWRRRGCRRARIVRIGKMRRLRLQCVDRYEQRRVARAQLRRDGLDLRALLISELELSGMCNGQRKNLLGLP